LSAPGNPIAEHVPDVSGSNIRPHIFFAGTVAASIIIYWKTFSALALFSLHEESSSHIPLIPAISIYLLYVERRRIFESVRTNALLGALLILAGMVLHWFAAAPHSVEGHLSLLPAETLSVVLLWIGVFTFCYGTRALRAAAFPLAFLLLMVPIPEAILARTIYFLQSGSTNIAFFLFRALRVPVLRQGFLLTLPGVTIEVAKECSGIRSSTALFITCLLAAHLFLRTAWKKLLFVLLALPLALLKNAIRIVTLTLLSIYVDPSFLTGNLHNRGGFVFFLLALAILAPILMLLEKSEPIQSPLIAVVPAEPTPKI
jgi:exosortase